MEYFLHNVGADFDNYKPIIHWELEFSAPGQDEEGGLYTEHFVLLSVENSEDSRTFFFRNHYGKTMELATVLTDDRGDYEIYFVGGDGLCVETSPPNLGYHLYKKIDREYFS